MDTKKISFGFSKLTKKPTLLINNKEKQESKVELIKCLEGHEIKLIEEKQVEAPLIIPLKESQKTSTALASLLRRRAVLLGEPDEPPPPTEATANANGNALPPANETLEQRAARELLSQVQSNGDSADTNQNLVLPILKPDELPLDGAKESTMNDYESIPIEQFGRAMLRGMGWVEPPKQKKAEGTTAEDIPFARPKGMGLGADKALKAKPLLVAPEKNEVLEIKKHAYVRILGGKFKDLYGQIEGFDDHAARVIVKMAIGGTREAFNEFLCQPVSKQEYAQYGKCINTAKYEEYKKMENEHGQIIRKPDVEEKQRVKKEEITDIKSERRRTNERDRDETPSSTSRKEYKYDNKGGQERIRVKEESRRRYAGDYRDTSNFRNRRDDNEEHVKRHERPDERHNKLDEHSKRKSRDRERERPEREHSDSRERRVLSASSSVQRRQQYTDDTSASSGTDSDSDSAYERKHKKKSSHNKSKAKKKNSKKSKHRKQKHKRDSSDTEDSSDSDDDIRRHRQHKKKTKKSKKPRSRTRSRSRSRSHSRTGRR